MLVISLLRFSISSLFSLEHYTFLRICPYLPSCPFYLHIVADSSLLYSCSGLRLRKRIWCWEKPAVASRDPAPSENLKKTMGGSALLRIAGLPILGSSRETEPTERVCKTLIAFALLHFLLQGQTCLLLQVSLDSHFCIPVPYDEKDIFFFSGGLRPLVELCVEPAGLCGPVPGILQARTLEWVAISFSNA